MLIWGMIVFGLVTLVAGLLLVRPRMESASAVRKILLLGPVFEAVALAMFTAEHFFAARALMGVVPKWLPGALFWTYFAGLALLAAALSFVAWRYVRLSSMWLAIFFIIIVVTVDLPNLPASAHDRFFWILTVRESTFASGALVLSGSLWHRENLVGQKLMLFGRIFVGCAMVFYAVQHFLHPRNVPGVPLENLIPAWMPLPQLLSGCIGIVLLLCGIGLLTKFSALASAAAGTVLVLLTIFFYVPIFIMERNTPQALEGLNYIGDTLLFASTVLLAGFGAETSAGASFQPADERNPR